MRVIKQSYKIEVFEPKQALKVIEEAGRTCYQSEVKGLSETFVYKIIRMGHLSVLEHYNITVRFVTDRGVTHELVRHRLVSYSQESTRYCNYGKGITVILPVWWYQLYESNRKGFALWKQAMKIAESSYLKLLKDGYSPQEARTVLPNSLKTEIVVTANVREWRHIFALRCSSKAHPQMRELMRGLFVELRNRCPVFFGDIKWD